MKKIILLLLTLTPAIANANNQNSLNNILNNNGSVGNVTINQSNQVTEEQMASEEKIDAILMMIKNAADSGTSTAQNNQLAIIAEQASTINAQNASTGQKNQLCKSKVKVGASFFGYDVDFGLKTCDEIFTVTQ
ncbi:hypothetical protein K6U40_13225 [Vibrio fluvialis]|uniref:hypothetical protein n=1 Tax=Vibrio fluvialis TaxID=676 RepID=UPI001EE9B300|nr:hypothetical protein [Vibrio fluvialis]MCG6346455.1 hypothetical protein [Vibrio fluvialis]